MIHELLNDFRSSLIEATGVKDPIVSLVLDDKVFDKIVESYKGMGLAVKTQPCMRPSAKDTCFLVGVELRRENQTHPPWES